MPFRQIIKLSFDKHMNSFREKFKAMFSTRNNDAVVTPQVEPQNSTNFNNAHSYDAGSSRQLPGHLIIGEIAQEKALGIIVTNPLNDNGIAQYFDSELMSQLPDRFAIGGVGMHSIEQSDIQVTDVGENDFNGLPAKLFLEGDDHQEIDTVENQVPGGDENWVFGFKEHSTASVASIALIAKHRTVAASNSLGSGDRVSTCSQRDLTAETALLPQDSTTTMPIHSSSSSNTVNNVDSTEVTIQDADSDTVSSSSSFATSNTCDTPAKVQVVDDISRALRFSVEELRQHYLNGHLNSPEPYSSIRGNNFIEALRRHENGEFPIDYSGQVEMMNETNDEATVDATEETHS